ncbi:MAG: hypothetical protein ACLPYS_16910 [Vulcanimicrobiaceae bacterium]
MQARTARPHAPSLWTAALTLALTIGGCGNNSTSSGNASPGIAQAPQSGTSNGAPQHRRRHRRSRHHSYAAAGVGAAAGAAGGGAAVASTGGTGAPVAASSGTWPCSDSQFVQDQQQFANGSLRGDQEVDVCGTVTQVLASKVTRSGLHGYYSIQVAPGDTIEIVSDLGEMDAPAWPWVKAGDYSFVQGRYYYDSTFSQGIDWTHHGTSNSWPTAGYVVVNGTEYQ